MRELAMLCHYQGLPVAAPLYSPSSSKPSINTLSEEFVARLQANVPSSVSTILRTACKLQAFPWNKQVQARGQPAGQLPAAPDVLCPICSSPLTDAEIEDTCQSMAQESTEALHQNSFCSTCCHSCRFQILPSRASCEASVRHDPAAHGSASLLDPMLMPPIIQQRNHHIREAATPIAQAGDLTSDRLQNGSADASGAETSSRERMRAHLAAYLLD